MVTGKRHRQRSYTKQPGRRKKSSAARSARSSFYVIAACGAMCMLVVQTMLNVLGCMDILPLTGVTFPFVSNGGSSMLASWGLLAFVKAVDTRRNSSWVTKSETAPDLYYDDEEALS